MNYHELSDLKQHTLIKRTSPHTTWSALSLTEMKARFWQSHVPFKRFWRWIHVQAHPGVGRIWSNASIGLRSLFVCCLSDRDHSRLLKATHIPCLVAPRSVLKAGRCRSSPLPLRPCWSLSACLSHHISPTSQLFGPLLLLRAHGSTSDPPDHPGKSPYFKVCRSVPNFFCWFFQQHLG